LNMTFRKNDSGSIDMVNTGVMLVVLLVVLYIGINIIDNVEEATAVDIGSAATAIWTTGAANVTTGEYVNITAGGVTYAFEFNTTGTGVTAGFINVDVSGGWNTSGLVHTNLTAAINGNTTLAALITAVNTTTGAANTTTITADARGVAANSYALVDGTSTGVWSPVSAMSGGVDDDTFYTTNVALIATTDSSYAMAGIMPIVMIAVAVLAGLLGILYLFRGRD